MPIVTLAVLAAMSGTLLQDQAAPRVETRSEVRVIRVDGAPGSGRMDADGDGVVTREEFMAPLASAFDRMDTNGDGRLSVEELAAGAPAGHGSNISQIITSLDGRGPGPGPGGHPRVMMFGGPGGGPGTEIVTIRRDGPEGAPPPGMPGQTQVFVRRFGGPDGQGDLDKSGDGKVSEDEFLAPLRDTFRSLDTDGNGFLDDGETPPPPPPPPAPPRAR